MVPGYNSDRWIAYFLCDHTQINYVYTLLQKSSSLIVVQDFIAFILHQYSQDVQVICLDGETLLSSNLNTWASKKGIIIEWLVPYIPAQNGVAERLEKEIVIKARAIRISSNLPENL